MRPKQIMLIAGEASGDLLAADLVGALREELLAAETHFTADLQPLQTGLEPRFFGAGGPRMKSAGVELAFDLTQHAVIGLSDALKDYLKVRRLFRGQLFKLAIERQPDVIVGVDYGFYNLRFGHTIRQYVRNRSGWFHGWRPKIVQYVSPQVWASRGGRAYQLARNHDLLLSIFPFEQEWYATRVPNLRVEFVGHPMLDRFQKVEGEKQETERSAATPELLLLPGSRNKELTRHLPVMLAALKLIREKIPAIRARIVLPDDSLAQQAGPMDVPADVKVQVGGLPEALAHADLAIAKTGTVTMECAYFGVPAVTLYKTSWGNWEVAKRIATVNWATMPNLLAGEELFPEFIQNAATPENISRAALELLQNEPRRAQIRKRLQAIIASLGGPGASRRAAQAITRLLTTNEHE
jgi:lipid-A-disaccharide synthase